MRQIKIFDITMMPSEAIKLIGERIAAQRLGLNWTQKELAEKAGISLRTLIRLESGEGNPGLESLVGVCCALNLTNRFNILLPEVQMTPQHILEGEKTRERARKRGAAKEWKWGGEE